MMTRASRLAAGNCRGLPCYYRVLPGGTAVNRMEAGVESCDPGRACRLWYPPGKARGHSGEGCEGTYMCREGVLPLER